MANFAVSAYVDLSSTSTDSATLSFVLGDTTVNQYKVKVTQYSCNDPGITIQNGCFQYFTGVTGTIDSYNFANSAQLATLEYNNCIRQEEGYCCIEYSVISFTLGAITCANAAANRCSGASLCVSEYITIPQVVTNQPPANYDRLVAFKSLYLLISHSQVLWSQSKPSRISSHQPSYD